MSRGLLTGRLALSLVLSLGLAAIILAGCGKGDQEDVSAQQKPRSLVPGAVLDSAVVDTGAVLPEETVYEAGTLPDAEGVRGDPVAGETRTQDSRAEIKAVVTETEAKPEPTVTRPAISVSSGEGAYGLQLGSFTNLTNARKQADRISALGYAPVIEESDLGGQVYHRVMLRGVGDMAEASRLGEFIHAELGIAYLVRRGN